MAIYLKLKKQPDTVEELIKILFSSYRNYTSEWIKSVVTYKDINCKLIQCNDYKYRSIDEFIEIIKTYFPNETKKEILLKLLTTTIIYNNNIYYLRGFNCTTIFKAVMGFQNINALILNHSNIIISSSTNDTWNSKINWKKAFKIMELTHEEVCAIIKDNYLKIKNELKLKEGIK